MGEGDAMTAKTNTASSQAEELRALLDRASKAIEEKRRVAGAIQALESQIAQAQERLQTATNRKEAE
jgi:outer membrane murein-binding lipoprotein Lpp